MFDEIHLLCITVKANLTVYMDDISISMDGLNRPLLKRVNGIITRYGYQHHKHRCYKRNQTKVVTGIVLGKGKYFVTKDIYEKQKTACSSLSSKRRAAYIEYVESH